MNCSNCQNPIQQGEKFCGSCGSPAGVVPVANVQYSPPQEAGSKKIIFIVVGIVVLLVAISAAAFWFFTRGKSDAVIVETETRAISVPVVEDVTKVTPNVLTVDTSNAKEDSFDFLGTKFVFGWQGGDEKVGQVMYEFFPEGETENTWTQMVSVVRNVGKQMSPAEAKEVFKATMSGLVSKGAVVSTQAEIDNTQTAIFSFTAKNNAEVDIKKAFVYKGEYIGVTYSVRVSGGSEADVRQKVTDQIGKMKTIQDQFMKLRVPFLWESQKIVKKYPDDLSLVFQESGAGFSMKYPEGWNKNIVGKNIFVFTGPTDVDGSIISVNVVTDGSIALEDFKKYLIDKKQGKILYEREYIYSKEGADISGKDLGIEYLNDEKYWRERVIRLHVAGNQSGYHSWSLIASGKNVDLANKLYVKYADLGRQMLDSLEITAK